MSRLVGIRRVHSKKLVPRVGPRGSALRFNPQAVVAQSREVERLSDTGRLAAEQHALEAECLGICARSGVVDFVGPKQNPRRFDGQIQPRGLQRSNLHGHIASDSFRRKLIESICQRHGELAVLRSVKHRLEPEAVRNGNGGASHGTTVQAAEGAFHHTCGQLRKQ